MAIYKETERVLTSTCDISIDYAMRVWKPNVAGYGGAYVNGRVGEGGAHMAWFGSWEFDQTTGPGRTGYWNYSIKMILTTGNGHGVTSSTTITITSGEVPNSQFSKDIVLNVSGSWIGTGTADVLWDITEEADPTTIELIKWPRKTSIDYYEYSKPGATMSSTLTFAGQSCVASGTVGMQKIRANYEFKSKLEGFAEDDATSTCTLSNIEINGSDVYSASHSHSFNGQSAGNWSTTVSAGSGAFSTTLVESSARIQAAVTVNAIARAWDAAYPLPLTWRIYGFDNSSLGYRDVTGTGSISSTDYFEKYKFKSTLYGGGATDIKTTEFADIPEKILSSITGASLTSANEDSAQTRVLMRGWRFPGWDLTQTNNRVIAGTGNTRNYTPWEGMSGYRYLDVQVKCQSGTNQTGVIEILDFHGNPKRWTVTPSTTAYEIIRLDLCSPDDGPSTDSKDDPYPRVNTANNANAGSESVDSPYWGVTCAKSLRVASGSIDIGTTTLVFENSNSTYVPSGREHRVERITESVVSESGTKTTFWARRFWQQDRDGRTEEESDVWWSKTEGGATTVTFYTVDPQTISELAGQINISDDGVVRHPGWTATNSVALPGGGACSVALPLLSSCYLNGETGYATWLYGAGILAKPATSQGTEFVFGHYITSGSGNTAVTAQTLFDEINGTFPPDRPDPFDVSGGTDVGLTLAGGTIFGGIGHGAVLKQNGDPQTVGTVYLKLDSDNSDRGYDDTLDTIGRYYTGTPKGLGEKGHRIEYTDLSIACLIHTSKRQRGWFKGLTTPLDGSGIWLANSEAWELQRLYLTDGKLVTGLSTVPVAQNWEDNSSTVQADSGWIAWQRKSEERRLVILYAKSGVVYRRTSINYGETLSVPTTIFASGTKPAMCIDDTGNEIYFCRTSTGAMKTVVHDPQGNIIVAERTIVASGVDDQPIGCEYRDTNIIVLYSGGGVIKTIKSTDYESYS